MPREAKTFSPPHLGHFLRQIVVEEGDNVKVGSNPVQADVTRTDQPLDGCLCVSHTGWRHLWLQSHMTVTLSRNNEQGEKTISIFNANLYNALIQETNQGMNYQRTLAQIEIILTKKIRF